jgi:hypothetical protein
LFCRTCNPVMVEAFLAHPGGYLAPLLQVIARLTRIDNTSCPIVTVLDVAIDREKRYSGGCASSKR